MYNKLFKLLLILIINIFKFITMLFKKKTKFYIIYYYVSFLLIFPIKINNFFNLTTTKGFRKPENAFKTLLVYLQYINCFCHI